MRKLRKEREDLREKVAFWKAADDAEENELLWIDLGWGKDEQTQASEGWVQCPPKDY